VTEEFKMREVPYSFVWCLRCDQLLGGTQNPRFAKDLIRCSHCGSIFTPSAEDGTLTISAFGPSALQPRIIDHDPDTREVD
jgi:hypothetical protein